MRSDTIKVSKETEWKIFLAFSDHDIQFINVVVVKLVFIRKILFDISDGVGIQFPRDIPFAQRALQVCSWDQ